MEDKKQLSWEILKQKAIDFYINNTNLMEEVNKLLAVYLRELALEYCIKNKLPKDAVTISTRIKTLDSFLKKLSRRKFPSFYAPTDIITDLIGGRVTCWFLEDCYGMLGEIISLKTINTRKETLEDYIGQPKKSGYRSIHILADIWRNNTNNEKNSDEIKPGILNFVCEIQLRTVLQDFWGNLTHEFHYTGNEFGDNQDLYEKLVSEMADRFASEDEATFALRNLYQSRDC